MQALWKIAFSLLLVSGCDSEISPPQTGANLHLRIQLPAALRERPARWERFLARVRFLELRVWSAHTGEQRQFFSASQWDKIELGKLSFPETPQDKLHVWASVWDFQADKQPRSYAVLTGKAHITAQEVVSGEPTEILLRLSLRVSVKEFDG